MFVVEATPTSPDGLEGGVNEHTDGTSTPQEEPVTPVAYPYIQPMKACVHNTVESSIYLRLLEPPDHCILRTPKDSATGGC